MIHIRSRSWIFLNNQLTLNLILESFNFLLIHCARQILNIINGHIKKICINSFCNPLLCHFTCNVKNILILCETVCSMVAKEKRLTNTSSCHDNIQSFLWCTTTSNRVEVLKIERNFLFYSMIEIISLFSILDVIMTDMCIKRNR